MFPRRSTVTRGLLSLVTFALIFSLWVSGPSGGDSVWRRIFAMPPLNYTSLQIELSDIRTKMNITANNTSLRTFDNRSVEELYDYVYELRKKLPVNPHNFNYIINPKQICDNKEIFIIAYIHSAPNHYKRRTSIRETWGNPRNFDDFVFRLVFLVGKPADQPVQDALLMESDMYGDIVQEDFVDSYRNLTYKGIMGLKWVKNYCSHARWVLKTDDDIFVNIFNVAEYLKNNYKHSKERVLLCLVWYRMKVVRDPKSKWYLSKSEFGADYFPTYCSGSAFIMTPDVSASMYDVSIVTPFFWVDDYYVTGLLAKQVGVRHQKYNSVYTLGPSTFLQKFMEDEKWKTLTFGHVHNINNMVQVWKKVIKDRKPDLAATQEERPGNKSDITRFIH